ncbi:hypothetical protein DK427_19835 [Methylobacterium radiodurans]|uniref:Anti-sigma factor NepR domain-containing protein n=1 Tax=Methylobacterium radiodurans TaxID=2202828 RepID=A0A2U8VV93_9HYPH|nr:hypothetical protein DK427_19835 [Methylobacterium radiodurans]
MRLMADDPANDERHLAESPTRAEGPGLSVDAQRRIGHHLQHLYAPTLRAPLDERLAELLNSIDAAAPKKPFADNDDSLLAGPWS